MEVSNELVTQAEALLNNPVWHALTHQQAAFALGDEQARCYPRDIGPFGALAANDADSFAHLAALIPSGETVALIGGHPPLGETWELLRQIPLIQMVYDGPTLDAVGAQDAITSLSHADVPAMLQLVELTHPGPFLPRTIELGRYLAVWQDGQLAAMAGERIHLPGYREISAVCTHPAFQRRGYARQLIVQLIHEIQSEGDVPFLHVFNENTGAIALYERLGFKRRADLALFVLKRQ